LFGRLEHYYPFAARASAKTTLNAFDLALKEAGIADYNLIKVSSIIPPGATLAPPDLPKGSLLPVAYGCLMSEEEGRFIVASVAVGIPVEPDGVGVIMEFSGFVDIKEAEEITKSMAYEALSMRGYRVKEVKAYSIGMEVRGPSCVLAGVALW
jgi:arginine decarboxylase